jgi:hypothetical protein
VSDLSRLLGDVYGTDAVEDHVVEAVPAQELAGELAGADLPAWADEALLDEAFADWVPGPPSDAPAAERDALTALATEPTEAVLPLPETLAEALPVEAEWFFDVPAETPATVGAVEPAPVVDLDADAPLVPWQRADDDLLPAKARRKKR